MSEELLQLLFFAFIFIALPAIDGVLRGRKKRRGPISRGPEDEAEVEWEPARGPEAPRDSAERPSPTGRAGTEAVRSSEGLLPADLWEELAALARGERKPDRAPSPDEDAPAGRDEPATMEPYTASSSGTEAGAYRARSQLPSAQRSRAPRPLPPKPTSRAPRRSWGEVEPGEVPVPTGDSPPRRPAQVAGPTPRRGELGVRGAFPDAEASPIETGAIGSAAEQGGHGAAADALVALHHMSRDDLKRAVIFREVLGPPISERPGPLAESREP